MLYPIDQSNITSKISSPVKRILVNRGDRVKAGQLLAELESADLAAAAKKASSSSIRRKPTFRPSRGHRSRRSDQSPGRCEAARQTLEAAKTLYNNRVELVKQGALAQKLADDARVDHGSGAEPVRYRSAPPSGAESGAQREQCAARRLRPTPPKPITKRRRPGRVCAIVSPIKGIVSDRPVYPGEMAAQRRPIFPWWIFRA